MFLRTSAMKNVFFCEMKEGCNVTCVKRIFLAALLGSQYLFEV